MSIPRSAPAPRASEPAAASETSDTPAAPESTAASAPPDILLQIAAERRARIERDGPAQGLSLPAERTLPLVPFAPADPPPGPAFFGLSSSLPAAPDSFPPDPSGPGTPNHPPHPASPCPHEAAEGSGHNPARSAAPLTASFTTPNPTAQQAAQPADSVAAPEASPPILIAEIKRRSPSAGGIAPIPEPAALAEQYKAAGFRCLSVLTEQDHFQGSLADLIAVKQAHPHLAVLRKDFLLTTRDITVSHRAGADAVLLIAALLPAALLRDMYTAARELGLTPLVEVHSAQDVAKVRPLSPPLIGINSRDLRRFVVDPLIPLETRTRIDWPCRIIYESGITSPDNALFVRGSGFHGFLAGEALAKNPPLASSLIAAWNDTSEAQRRFGAWGRLYSPGRPLPLVKICGITSLPDARAALDAGADILGFVLAESPRRTSPDLIRQCAHLPILKAAVVVLNSNDSLPASIVELLREGSLDFIQFHGNESPQTLTAWPGFKALSLKTPADAQSLSTYPTPAVLIDAFSPTERGGTGRTLNPRLIAAAAEHRRPWIAGGLTPENVAPIVRRWNPGLVDVSSGVTLDDGTKRRKNHQKIRHFTAQAKGALQ